MRCRSRCEWIGGVTSLADMAGASQALSLTRPASLFVCGFLQRAAKITTKFTALKKAAKKSK